MDRLLDAVLSGDWPISEAINWLRGGECRPPRLRNETWSSITRHNSKILSASEFENHILNYIRDQAEIILNAAELSAQQQQVPCPPDSIHKIHDPRTIKLTPTNVDARLRAVAQRLQPKTGLFNLPSSEFEQHIDYKEPCPPPPGFNQRSKLPKVAVASSHAERLISTPGIPSSPGTGSGGRNTPKRRIVPTQVAEVEVSHQFVTAPVAITSLSSPSSPSLHAASSHLAAAATPTGQGERYASGCMHILFFKLIKNRSCLEFLHEWFLFYYNPKP